jgi:hypothetical protein
MLFGKLILGLFLWFVKAHIYSFYEFRRREKEVPVQNAA